MSVCVCELLNVLCMMRSTGKCAESCAFVIQFSQLWKFVSEVVRR